MLCKVQANTIVPCLLGHPKWSTCSCFGTGVLASKTVIHFILKLNILDDIEVTLQLAMVWSRINMLCIAGATATCSFGLWRFRLKYGMESSKSTQWVDRIVWRWSLHRLWHHNVTRCWDGHNERCWDGFPLQWFPQELHGQECWQGRFYRESA